MASLRAIEQTGYPTPLAQTVCDVVACLTENAIQALLAGAVRSRQLDVIETHLDGCLPCQLLVSAGVRTMSRRTLSSKAELPDDFDGCRLETGQVLLQRYEVTRFIARGGMGEVYAAHDRMLGEEIALKVLLSPTSGREDDISRLRAEVQLARRVSDPHVLRVFDLASYESADGRNVPFLTMQLLRGETLRSRLLRGPLPSTEVWRLADDLSAALVAAHQIGVVHLDFKSDNVMLVPNDSGDVRAVVMDFGLARAIARDGASEERDPKPLIAGTLGYMAPEQLSNGIVTAAADIYAFGVVLHEMLTGVLPPFRPRVSRSRIRVPPPPLLLDGLDIPAAWRALIRRCLARDPADRFGSFTEVRVAMVNAKSRKRYVFAAATLAATAAFTGAGWKYSSSATVVPGTSSFPEPMSADFRSPSRSDATLNGSPSIGVEGIVQESQSVSTAARAERRRPAKGVVRPRQRRVSTSERHSADVPHSDRAVIDTDDAIDPFRSSR
jgi:serine/threonine protein kinase